jgi:hypothetical protein
MSWSSSILPSLSGACSTIRRRREIIHFFITKTQSFQFYDESPAPGDAGRQGATNELNLSALGISLLGKSDDLAGEAWINDPRIQLREFRPRIFSIAEQWAAARGEYQNIDLLWIPQYNLPLLYQVKFLVTIHDLCQSDHRSFPKRTITVLVAMLIGFFAACGWCLLAGGLKHLESNREGRKCLDALRAPFR